MHADVHPGDNRHHDHKQHGGAKQHFVAIRLSNVLRFHRHLLADAPLARRTLQHPTIAGLLTPLVGTAAVNTAEHGRHLIRAATVPVGTRRSFAAISNHYRATRAHQRANNARSELGWLSRLHATGSFRAFDFHLADTSSHRAFT